MDIATFGRLHGVLIDRPIEDGRWHRVPTESHPKKRNGAYMSRGVYGFIQDHAAHAEPIAWQPDKEEIARIDPAVIARQVAEAAAKIREDQQKAARKAAWMMNQCRPATHAYLVDKGFPEHKGHVFKSDATGANLLCIPMYAGGRIVGLQTISDLPAHERPGRNGEPEQVPAFEKRFLYGQQTMEAVHVMDNHGTKIFVEGFATGLSVRRAMQGLKRRYTLVVCFTAGNLLKVAQNFGEGIVIADYDLPSRQHPGRGGHGLAVAQQSGLPYWLSDRQGEDFNDFETRVKVFAAGRALLPLLSTPKPAIFAVARKQQP